MIHDDYNHKGHSPRSTRHMATSQSAMYHNFFKIKKHIYFFQSNIAICYPFNLGDLA
jgi:hypothetical protein